MDIDEGSSVSSGAEEQEKEQLGGVDSNAAVFLKMVRTVADIEDDSVAFHPECTHQIFGDDERIYGYINPRVNIYFASKSLLVYLSFTHEGLVKEEAKDRVDVLEKLTRENLGFFIGHDAPPVFARFTTDVGEFAREVEVATPSPGTVVHSFVDQDMRQVEILKVAHSDPSFRQLASALQTLAILFIDGASFIEVDDPNWNLFLVAERLEGESGPAHHIMGFTDVYGYFGYPDKVRMRISQFAVFPPFQRRGYGEQLLRSVYRLVLSSEEYMDLNVEDPGEDFERMRMVTEAKICQEGNVFNVGPDGVFPPWSKELCQEVVQKTKINRQHVRLCYEVLALISLQKSRDPEAMRQYRLSVKRRLYNQFLNIPDEEGHLQPILPAERKMRLQMAFEFIMKEYEKVIERVL